MERIAALFKDIYEKAGQILRALDSGGYLEGARARGFWTKDMRYFQAELLAGMLAAEREAAALAGDIII